MKQRLNTRLTLAVAVAAATLLGGCATLGPWDSQEAVILSVTDAKTVADAMVDVLVTEYAPGQTTFAMTRNKPGTFGVALEDKLRETGYAVSVGGEGKSAHALSMAYILDELGQPDTYRVGLRVEPTYRMDRVYRQDPTGALVPGSSVTVRDGTRNNAPYPAPAAHHTRPAMQDGPDDLPPASMIPPNAEKVSLDDYTKPDLAHNWQVQVMAGTNRYDLEKNQNRLARNGRESHIVPLGALHALRLGPLESATVAHAVMREMRADRYSDAYVVTPKGVRNE